MAEYILNKDYGLTVAASIFTSIGLGQNDIAQMIGGMILSPLANPIINSINDGNTTTNIIQLIVMILTCVVIGMIYFMAFLPDDFVPTERMLNLSDPDARSYWGDVIYGLVAGMVTYASHGQFKTGDINVLAGVAVGVTVLPAFVNAGIMFAAGLYGYRDRHKWRHSYYGLASSTVGIIYLTFIYAGFVLSKFIDESYVSGTDTFTK